MKSFLRASLVAGLFAVATLAHGADTPAPPIAPNNKAAAAPAAIAKPGAPTTITSTNACNDCSANKVLGGRLGGRFGSRQGFARAGGLSGGVYAGRIDGSRADQLAEGYLAAGDRIGAFFSRLAGPPVDVAATPHGGFNKGGPHTQPGTVVFPQHPFVRSPRDFFMTEQP